MGVLLKKFVYFLKKKLLKKECFRRGRGCLRTEVLEEELASEPAFLLLVVARLHPAGSVDVIAFGPRVSHPISTTRNGHQLGFYFLNKFIFLPNFTAKKSNFIPQISKLKFLRQNQRQKSYVRRICIYDEI